MDIPACCRVCMSQKELNPIFKEHDDEEKYELLFNLIAGERLSKKDEIPTLLCTECVKFINESIRFRKTCAKSTQILQGNLSNGCKYKNYQQMTCNFKNFVYMDVDHYFDLDGFEREDEQFMEASDVDIQSEIVLGMFRDKLNNLTANNYTEGSSSNYEFKNSKSDKDKDGIDSKDEKAASEKILEFFRSHINTMNNCENVKVKIEKINENSDVDDKLEDDGIVVLEVMDAETDGSPSWEIPIKNEIVKQENEDNDLVEEFLENSDEDDTVPDKKDDNEGEASTKYVFRTYMNVQKDDQANNAMECLNTTREHEVISVKKENHSEVNSVPIEEASTEAVLSMFREHMNLPKYVQRSYVNIRPKLEKRDDVAVSVKTKGAVPIEVESTETILSMFRKHMNLPAYDGKKAATESTEEKKEKPVKKEREKEKILKEYICVICNRPFKSFYSKRKCSRHVERVICEHCGITVRKPFYLYHCKAAHGYKKDKCELCNYEANDIEALRVHVRTHTGEKPYQCEKCGAAFHRHNTYKQHLSVHNTERIFKCNLCSKMFKSMPSLHCHKHIVHKKRKYEFRCNICNKVYGKHYVALTHIVKLHHIEKEDARKHIERLNKLLT